MSSEKGRLLSEALNLSPIDRAELVDDLLQSFEFPSRADVDSLWAGEAEERINAYERGEISEASAKEVFDGIERKRS